MTITKQRLSEIIREEFDALQEGCLPSASSLPNFTEQEIATLQENGIEIPQELQEVLPAALATAGRAAVPLVKKAVIEIGEAYIIEKLSSSSGRNELADTLVAVAKLAENLCNLNDHYDEIAAAGAKRAGFEMPKILQGIVGKVCRRGVRFFVSPIILLASAIRSLDDAVSGLIVGKMKGEEGAPQPPALKPPPDEEETP